MTTNCHPATGLIPARKSDLGSSSYDVQKFKLKVWCRVSIFKTVGNKDVSDRAYRDVFTAVLKMLTRCQTATAPKQSQL